MRRLAIGMFLAGGILSAAPNSAVLAGLKDVQVVIERLDTAVEDAGLSQDLLRTDVELRLRQAGITVIKKSDQHVSDPQIYVVVTCLETSTHGFACSYSMALVEYAELVRSLSDLFYPVTTWRAHGILISPKAEISTETRKAIGDILDEFINGYLAENQGRAR